MNTVRSDQRAAIASGFLWGLAESLFFFIVPDVLLCFWAVRSAKSALAATLSVVLGAMLGASILYGFLHAGLIRYEQFHAIWGVFPGFKPKMAEVSFWQLSGSGAVGLLSGPSSGIPYRVYVLEGWRLQIPLDKILLWTPIARLERILIAPVVVLGLRAVVDHFLAKKFSSVSKEYWKTGLIVFICIYWILLYAWYWGKMVPRVYG